MMGLHLLLTVTVGFSFATVVSASCDTISLPKCDCKYPMAKRYEIACENVGLTALPAKVNYTLNDGFANGNFSFNKISEIPEFYFYNMKHFDILDFTSNKISKLTELTFRGLETRLTSLNLSNNVISSIPPQAFREYIRLKDLDLSGNSIKSPCSIHTADVLRYSLAKNGITKLKDQCFQNSAKVTNLDLSGNEIHEIEQQAFDGLSSLVHLDLADNEITDLRGVLNPLVRLENFQHLSLKGNKLKENMYTSVCQYAFPHLRVLNLGYNNFVFITKYCFQDYDRFNQDVPFELNFEHNSIEALDASVFDGLGKRLSHLKLNNNKITLVNIDTFKDQQKLVYLNLDNNRLTDLEFLRHWGQNIVTELSVANNEIAQLSSNVFLNMKKLVKLSLDGNRLLHIESGVFNGLSALDDLSVRYNLLTNMDDQAFTGLEKLKKLGLSGNALITMKNCTFAGLTSLQQFHFEDNLLQCDCDLVWLLKFILAVNSRGKAARSRQESHISEPVLEDYCHYPESAEGNFVQNEVSEHCPDNRNKGTCFSLTTLIDEPENDGKANVSWTWDVGKGSKPTSIILTQTDIKTGKVVFNESSMGQFVRTLQGFKDENMYKVCVRIVLPNSEQQKDCAIWPKMIKKPTTVAPIVQTSTTESSLHPGSQAAIALAVILIIIIIIIVIIAVYLWKTQKYRHLLPDKYVKASHTDSEQGSLEKSPDSNGKAKGDSLDFRPAEETHPMMRPPYTEHDL